MYESDIFYCNIIATYEVLTFFKWSVFKKKERIFGVETLWNEAIMVYDTDIFYCGIIATYEVFQSFSNDLFLRRKEEYSV